MGIDANILWGWGYNKYGQLGLGDSDDRCSPVPVSIAKSFIEVSNGRFHTVAIDMNYQTYCWGYAYYGQIGDDDVVNRCTPTLIIEVGVNFVKVSAGNYHNLAIDNNGMGWAWGGGAINPTDNYGQLGNNSNINESVPVMVYGSRSFTKISGGMHFSLAIDNNGQGWAWGNNISGKLGVGDTVCYSTPVAIIGGHTFCEISAGGHFSLAIDNNGQGWAWGDNPYGQIGNNSHGTGPYTSPQSVWGNHTFCKISTGFGFSLAIDNNNLLWGWGDNEYGQLDNNNIQCRFTPFLIYI
jgi:alpha-tubulin suppressor-like RCC1 family protein